MQCPVRSAGPHRAPVLIFSQVALPAEVVAGLRLLERERQLRRVSALLAAAKVGEPSLAVMEGAAGAGKSAVLSVLAARAAGQGFMVLRATALELEREYPFGVVRQLFEPAVQSLERPVRDELFAGTAALAEPLLAGREALSGPRLADPGFALLHSLYWVLVGLTDLAPLALVVDDLQWADVPSLRFLAFALKRSDGLPLLVAVAHRPQPPKEQSAALATVLGGRTSVIDLPPLSTAAIASVISNAVGSQVSADLIGEAELLTNGNPLYVTELADSLTSAGEAGRGDLLGLLRDAAPAAIGRRVQTTLAGLDPVSRAVAAAAAILGERVPLHRVARLADVEYASASIAADALARAHIFVVGEPLQFRHPLVREAVLESIEPRARAVSQGQAARLLLADGEPPERASVHLLQSDPAADPEVVATLRIAAKRAVAESAPELGIKTLRRALREPPAGSERFVVLNELAMAEALVGDPHARQHYQQAFGGAETLDEMADGAVRYGMLLGSGGEQDKAVVLIDRVLASIRDRERRLMVQAELATLTLNWEIPGARGRLIEATAGLRGDTPAERLLLGLSAMNATNTGAMTAADGVGLVRAALGDGWLLAELGPDSPTYLHLLAALTRMEETPAAEREAAAAVVEARRRGAGFGFAVASSILALRHWVRGQLIAGEAEARTAVEVATQMGWLAGFPLPLASLLEVLTERGEVQDADRLLEEYGLNGPIPKAQIVTEFLGARGRLRLAQGRDAEGIEALEEEAARIEAAEETPTNLGVGLTALNTKSLVPPLLRAGRVEQARSMAGRALRLARGFGHPRYIADALRADALARAGTPDLDQLQEASDLYEQIDAPVDVARVMVDLGSILRRQRSPAAAREPLRRALDLARACGARPLAERAEHELRATGARPRRDRFTGRDALTASEQRIAQLAIDGMTNRQIAQRLFITRKTVGSHLEHIFRKLGIHSRGELEGALAAEAEPVTAASVTPP